MQAEFAKLGVSVPIDIEDDPDVCQVWLINALSFRAFLTLGTQWRVVPLVGMSIAVLLRLGLDYSAVPLVMDMLDITDRAEVFADIQVMEHAALNAFGEVMD